MLHEGEQKDHLTNLEELVFLYFVLPVYLVIQELKFGVEISTPFQAYSRE